MVPDNGVSEKDVPFSTRLRRVVLSITLMTFVTVVVGYGGGLVLTLSAKLGGPDPETADGDPLRERLLAWPDRNRDVMRTNGVVAVPWRP